MTFVRGDFVGGCMGVCGVISGWTMGDLSGPNFLVVAYYLFSPFPFSNILALHLSPFHPPNTPIPHTTPIPSQVPLHLTSNPVKSFRYD